MNLFNTTDLGGLPLRLNDFRFMQDAWREGFSGFLSSFGLDPNVLYLISANGYELAGNIISSNEYYIAYGNEIYRGEAFSQDLSALAPGENLYVKLTEVDDASGTKIFANGITRETYKVRKAEVEVAFVAPTDSDILQDAFDRKAVYGLRNNIYAPGQVSMYAGSRSNFDASGLGNGELIGWALCNGNNSTTNLSGKFIASLDEDDLDNDMSTIGQTGGSHTHQLTLDEIPSHKHAINDPGHDHGGVPERNGTQLQATVGGGAYQVNITDIDTDNANTGITETEDTGGGAFGTAAHNNKPAYYTLAFIQYIGF